MTHYFHFCFIYSLPETNLLTQQVKVKSSEEPRKLKKKFKEKMRTLQGKNPLAIHFFFHKLRALHRSSVNRCTKSVKNGNQKIFSCADYRHDTFWSVCSPCWVFSWARVGQKWMKGCQKTSLQGPPTEQIITPWVYIVESINSVVITLLIESLCFVKTQYYCRFRRIWRSMSGWCAVVPKTVL